MKKKGEREEKIKERALLLKSNKTRLFYVTFRVLNAFVYVFSFHSLAPLLPLPSQDRILFLLSLPHYK